MTNQKKKTRGKTEKEIKSKRHKEVVYDERSQA